MAKLVNDGTIVYGMVTVIVDGKMWGCDDFDKSKKSNTFNKLKKPKLSHWMARNAIKISGQK